MREFHTWKKQKRMSDARARIKCLNEMFFAHIVRARASSGMNLDGESNEHKKKFVDSAQHQANCLEHCMTLKKYTN